MGRGIFETNGTEDFVSLLVPKGTGFFGNSEINFSRVLGFFGNLAVDLLNLPKKPVPFGKSENLGKFYKSSGFSLYLA